jgi:tripartite-type tricarboxylate transporter receptor subunit TctC
MIGYPMFKHAICSALAALSLIAEGAYAADPVYPSKPIRIVVPYPAGGSLDVVARAIAQHLTTKWGQPVLVDNKPGGSAMIGTDIVAKSPPDGYTLLASASSEVGMNVALFPKMPYDPIADLTPITLIATTPVAILVNPSTNVKSLPELLAATKSQTSLRLYAIPGNGTPQHFAGELLKLRTKIDFSPVPYKGAAPLINDLVAGQVSVGLLALPSVMPYIKSGKMRALAVTTPERSALLPEVPTVAELGYPDFEVGQWLAMFGPAHMPPEIVQALNREVSAFITEASFRERLKQMGADAVGSSPESLRKVQSSDIANYRAIASQTGIKSD